MGNDATRVDGGVKTFTSGEALAINRRVKLSASDTVIYADAEHDALGVTLGACDSGDPIEVKLRTAEGTVVCTAAGVVTVGDIVYGADDGKVDDNPAGVPFGQAFQTAAADGDEIEVLPLASVIEGQGNQVELTGGAGGLAANDLVYISDQTDNVMTALKAQGTSGGYFADYIVPQAIAAAGVGVAFKTWLLAGIDTSAGSVGDPVYLDDGTAGGYTLTKPTGTDKIQIVGYIREDDASTGAILFDLRGPVQIVHTHADNSEGGLVPATSLTVADSGSLITATTVEAALAEIFQHEQSAQKMLVFPIGSFQEQDGTALADFADGASPTPGYSAGDEGYGIRWNNHANPDPISCSVPYPPDLDPAVDAVVHILAAKVGATVGDAVTWLIEAFENIDGAAYDADADFGGTSSAMTGDATTKTCQEETLTLANANITGAPGVLTITIQPTDGTLGTDDVILLGVWIEYQGRILTS